MVCSKCGLDYNTQNALYSHESRCKLTPNDIDSIIQDYNSKKLSTREISSLYGVSFTIIKKILGNDIRKNAEALKVCFEKSPRVLSEETKIKISESRKKYLEKNPDKRKWTENESLPSILFKKILGDNNISFVSEFRPLSNRFFSIDVAFPDKMIGIEINGNQHYDSFGNLKEYYQKRHDLITQNGWKLFEIKSKLVYNKEFMINFVKGLKEDFDVDEFDYSEYTQIKEKKVCLCGNRMSNGSKKCNECSKNNKLSDSEILRRLNLLDNININQYGWVSKASQILGISHTQVRRFILKYEKNKVGLSGLEPDTPDL